jgi:hypothetical protein
MGNLLGLCRGWQGVSESGEVKLLEDGTEACLQAALFCGSEGVGDAKVGEVVESLADVLETVLALAQRGGEDGTGV